MHISRKRWKQLLCSRKITVETRWRAAKWGIVLWSRELDAKDPSKCVSVMGDELLEEGI